eukprot:6211934-Pleurochrysis_carterae.AAC.2
MRSVRDAGCHKVLDCDEWRGRARPGGADAERSALRVRRELERSFGVAFAVQHRDHSLVELVVLGGVAVGRERRCALLVVFGLLVETVALAVGALSVPVGPVAIPATCMTLVPGRALRLGVTWRVSSAVAVAIVALMFAVRVTSGSQKCSSAFVEFDLPAQLASFMVAEYVANSAQRDR